MTKKLDIKLPAKVMFIIQTLNEAGFEAYIVGGSIRNILLGKVPDDWDITTSAEPSQVSEVFSDLKIIPTGIKHGTVAVLLDSEIYEVTTYRLDGEYTDFRRPDSVTFTKSLREDLARRDFTINAVAYHPDKGLVDYFGGVKDINSRVIRAVGSPEQRFNEDALRILRGVRFTAQLGFTLEKHTNIAMNKLKDNLDRIAKERLQAELVKMLMGENIKETLLMHSEIISHIIPELKPMIGFNQHSKYHKYDVYIHTAVAVGASEQREEIRITMLFHDIGKPKTFKLDPKDNSGHFKRHGIIGEAVTKKIMLGLKFSSYLIQTVGTLIKYHDRLVPRSEKAMRKTLNLLGEPMLRLLFEVQHADAMAKADVHREKAIIKIAEAKILLNKVLSESQCFSLKQLNINGADIIRLGVGEGEKVGIILNKLLDLVIDGEIENAPHLLKEKALELVQNLCQQGN